jgi:hypothetical protein
MFSIGLFGAEESLAVFSLCVCEWVLVVRFGCCCVFLLRIVFLMLGFVAWKV